MNKVRFFGTTGDKDLMFHNKLIPGGIYLEIFGKKIIMDPGPGTFNNFNRTYPKMINELDSIILSHVHFDHSTDVNAMIEGMTDGGTKKRGKLITCNLAYEGNSQVIYNYLKSFPQETCLVNENRIIHLDKVKIEAVEHQHGISNYGYKFLYNGSCISVITDTRFFDELIEKYMGSTSTIINVPYYMFPEGKQPKHLCIADVKKILTKLRPQKTILTHFGKSMFESDINLIVKELEKELNLSIIAAEVGKDFELV